ncbi:MAG TPA: riboflavin synthase [Alphaproteobacteria bacterium]|nr:riboflavin synthase [Alphaproteobacteria bacterium]
MFTGIITDLGRVRAIAFGPTTRLEIATAYDTGGIALGASVACSGCCLSVVEKGPGWLAFEASRETLDKTNLGDWQVGRPVNLERALKLGDELGGHLVSGHVDGVGRILSITPDGGSLRIEVEAPMDLARMIAPKGSIVLDGISLTVNEVAGNRFGVNIIPITQTATNLGQAKAGDRVNLEIDLIARYVARLLAPTL